MVEGRMVGNHSFDSVYTSEGHQHIRVWVNHDSCYMGINEMHIHHIGNIRTEDNSLFLETRGIRIIFDSLQDAFDYALEVRE
jgi:hypothetical protein